MVSITLDGSDYDHILDVTFTESEAVSLPEWINDATPDLDTDIWNRKPLIVKYILRVTNAEKWTLDQILAGHAIIKLTDNTYGISNQDVWMTDIDVTWAGDINWANPWEIEITLVVKV